MPTQPEPTSADIALTPMLKHAAAETVLDCLKIAEDAFPDLATGAGALADATAIRKAATKNTELSGRLALHRIALGMGELTWNSGRDYLRAAAHDLTRHDPDPVWSTTSLVRSALEAEAGFAYLFQTEKDVRKRLGRTASVLLTDAHYAGQLAKTLGEPAIGSNGRYQRGLDRICDHAGAQVVEDPEKKERKIELAGAKVSEMVIANVITGFWPKDAGHPYTRLSGASHSRPWVLASGIAGGPTVVDVLIVSGLVLSTWLRLAGNYAGVDLTHEMEQISGYVAGTITEALAGDYS
ncbi:hypothetical protein [Kitasatospora sp. NPDC051914]|uniref:hypothetical protein n=1 Tax=Kitasatospora sp. NPDC051914 TaxID=3154945 RepID=UPI0034319B28